MLDMVADQEGYAAHFMDLAVWQSHVQWVCIRHGFGCEWVEPGVPGTFPTFIVETGQLDANQVSKKVVVKFFGPLFESNSSFTIERDMGSWLGTHPMPIASPRILAEGKLDQDWQYLIFEHVVGESMAQARAKLSTQDWLTLASQMGEYIHVLHAETKKSKSGLPQSIIPRTDHYIEFLMQQKANCAANHRAWDELPSQLVDQVAVFVLPIDQLVDISAQPHLIHADLTMDHLLGRLQGDTWQALAVIDWGDMRSGNLLYELVALHLDLFHADRNLLRLCLEAYEMPLFYQDDFPRKAMSMVLLHQFPMPSRVYAPYLEVTSLQELAECLFAI
jgi:hypothetical protein